jgi:hypothetical protein
MSCAAMAKFGPDIIPAEALALAASGGRIGLLGGSFNPAHEAHLHISLIALRRLKLDAVFWLVSPQNPLKDAADMAPLAAFAARTRGGGASEYLRCLDRNGARYAFHVRYVAGFEKEILKSPFRLADGRRQSGRVPSLASMGGYRQTGADGRHCASAIHNARAGEPGRATVARGT